MTFRREFVQRFWGEVGPFGQTMVPHTVSIVARAKYVGSLSGSNTGPSSNGVTSTVFFAPSLNVNLSEWVPATSPSVIRNIIDAPPSVDFMFGLF